MHRGPTQRPLCNALSRAIHQFALGGIAAASVLALPGVAIAQPAAAPTRNFSIAPGRLDDALGRFGREAGILLSFPTETTAGMRSNGLQGSYSVQGGLDALLAGSGLRATQQPNGSYVLTRQAAPAAAPAAAADAALPTVTVLGSAEGETATGPVDGYAAKRSATATKTDTPIIETPQSISVLGRSELESRGALDVTEALRYVPGVTVDQYGPDSRGQDWVNLRGFYGFGTALYLDGLPMATNANFANQRSEPYGLERIEVLRGPTSVLYGQGEAGGIVNRVSKRPRADAVNEIEVQLGNFNRRQVAADLGGKLDADGKLLYRIVGTGLDTGTQDKYSNGDRGANQRFYLAPSLTWKPSTDTTLTLLSEIKRDRNRGYAFYYTNPEPPPVGSITRVLVGEPNYNGFDQDQSSIGYQFEHRLNDTWTFRQNARVADVKVNYRRVQDGALLDDGHTIERNAAAFDEKTRQSVIDTQLQGKLRTGNVEHTLLVGTDWSERKLTFLRHPGTAPDLDTLFPVYGLPFAAPTELTDDSRQKLRQTGLYVQDQLRFDRHWLLTLGGRMDWASQSTVDRLAGTVQRQSDHAFSGRAGLTYLTDSGWAPYVRYATSFLPQAGRDFYDEAFKPTRGKQTEIGIKYAPEDSRSLFTAAVFDLTKRNVLTLDPDHTDYYLQTGEVRSRGLELEGKFSLARGLDATANYTWNDVKVTRSNDGNQGRMPVNTPKQTASAWLDYKVQGGDLQGVGFGVGVRYVGSTYDDAANTVRTPSFTLVDAAIHYERGPWRFALNVSNLANKKYVATCSSGCLWGSERTAVLSAKYRW